MLFCKLRVNRKDAGSTPVAEAIYAQRSLTVERPTVASGPPPGRATLFFCAIAIRLMGCDLSQRCVKASLDSSHSSDRAASKNTSLLFVGEVGFLTGPSRSFVLNAQTALNYIL